MGIRTKFIIVLVTFSIVPVLLLGFIASRISDRALYENIGKGSLEFARLVSNRVAERLYAIHENVLSWSKNKEFIDFLQYGMTSHKPTNRLFENFQQSYGGYRYFSLVDLHGRTVASSTDDLIGEPFTFKDSPAFQKALRGEYTIDEITFDDIINKYVLNFYAPVRNNTAIVGVLVASVDWGLFNEMIMNIKIRGEAQNMYDHIMILKNDGLVVSCYDHGELFSNNLIEMGKVSARNARDGKEGYVVEKSEHDQNSFSSYTFLKDYKGVDMPHWLIIVSQDYDVIFRSIHKLRVIVIMIAIAIGGLLGAIAYVIGKKITQPILYVASSARQIGGGNFDLLLEVSTGDEIETLAVSFNSMSKKLRETINELQFLNKNLEERVRMEVEDRRRKEQLLVQQSKMAAMGEMVGAIVHQWRQPLNVLAISLEDMQHTYTEGELTTEYMDRYVAETMDQVSHMSATISDFRNFLKPSRNKIAFSINSTINEIVYLVYTQLSRSSITLVHNCTYHHISNPSMERKFCSCEPEIYVKGYPNEFKQVLLNLIANAKDAIVEKQKKGLYAENETGLLTIGIAIRDEKAVITFQDNGIGIPKEIEARIFEAYVSSKGDEGIGIGLNMSKTIIEQNMNGMIYAESIDGGTILTIELDYEKD